MADVRAYEQWQAQAASGSHMTLAEHETNLRNISSSLNGAWVREAYMKEHRLRYEAGGILVQDPERVTDTHARLHANAQEAVGIADLLGLRAHKRAFTRAEVLTSLKAIAASKGGITEAITAFENLE
jgi:hypothetical protein